MKVYLEIIKNTFQEQITYRAEVLLQILFHLITIFVQIALWKILFEGQETVEINTGQVSYHEMVSYVLVSIGIHIFISNQIIPQIDNKIKTGEIAMDLIKPLSFKAMILSESLGKTFSQMIIILLPVLAFGSTLFEISLPSWNYLLLFFISLLNAFIIYSIICFNTGLLGFWYLEVWHLHRFLNDFIRLFSGVWIPLWFFPYWMENFFYYLPFRLIYYSPITIYLEKVPLAECFEIIILQWVWIGILFLIEKTIWVHGIKKLVIQGG